MADLFHLDKEILHHEPQQNDRNTEELGAATAATTEEEEELPEEWEVNQYDREEIELPSVVVASPQGLTKADWDEIGTTLNLKEFVDENTQKVQTQDLTYTRLYAAWAQECRSPELLPIDVELIDRVRCAVAERQEENEDSAAPETGNINIDALFRRLQHIDLQRAKFLLADLLQRRLAKIQAHPLYMRNLTDRMCEAEVGFLKEYGPAVERHLKTTVTNHFPQDAWKQLDAPEMIDEPDLDRFVFLRCLEDVVIEDEKDPNNNSMQETGNCLIVRYRRIRESCLQGKVELM